MTEREVLKLALEALEKYARDFGSSDLSVKAMYAVREALAQPEQEPVAKGKLKVTLQDTPTEIELAQYKRMFEAACSALGAIGEALGIDEEEGGAEPILAAIEELKAQPKEPEQEPVGFTIQSEIDYAKSNPKEYAGFWANKDDDDEDWIALYTTPPQRTWVGLTDEQLISIRDRVQQYTPIESVQYGFALQKATEQALKEKNT